MNYLQNYCTFGFNSETKRISFEKLPLHPKRIYNETDTPIQIS